MRDLRPDEGGSQGDLVIGSPGPASHECIRSFTGCTIDWDSEVKPLSRGCCFGDSRSLPRQEVCIPAPGRRLSVVGVADWWSHACSRPHPRLL